jgi:hypothetical protein
MNGNEHVETATAPHDRPSGVLVPSSRSEKRRRTNTNQGMTAPQRSWFDEWWALFWRRVAKKAAELAFQKHVQTEARFREVMAATRAQLPEMLQRHPSKRPHPATWLNGERWEDEVNSETRLASRGGSANKSAYIPPKNLLTSEKLEAMLRRRRENRAESPADSNGDQDLLSEAM